MGEPSQAMGSGADGAGRGGLRAQLLGPMELRLDGTTVPISAPQERSLLALLLTAAGRVVPVADIVAGMWGEQPPPRADKTVQSYVSRLRRAAGANAGLVVTRPPGYFVAVEPGDVDLVRFERLARQGRQALAEGRFGEAAGLLREAAGLWRGEALAEFDAPFAVRERTRLDELRLVAVEDRVGADLALGGGAELVGELEGLVAAQPLRERLWEHLIMALYRAGRQADALAAYRRVRSRLVEELGIEPGPALRDLERMVLTQDHALAERRARQVVDGAARELPTVRRALAAGQDRMTQGLLDLRHARDIGAAGSLDGVVVCPYKGLAAFEAADAPYFFGRHRLIAQLVTRLVGTRLLAVVGASGIGKSSAVRAGLLPALHAGTLPGSDTWSTAVLAPTEPLPDPADATDRRLLVIDQFEEVFTRLDRPARTTYLDCLVRLIQPAGDTICVLTVRADYYPRCAEHADLAALIADNTVLVGPMSRDELRTVIDGPAERAGLTLDAGLAELLLTDVDDQPGALPLLSTALLGLWEQRTGGRLTMAGYLAGGGVRQAIARLAEAAYQPLTAPQRLLARRILLRLADPGAGGDFVRRRAPLTEVAPAGEPEARRVVDQLARQRLVTVTGEGVEIAHEAVLREWPRLRAWLEEDDAGRRLRAHLAPAARDWAARGRDPAELYRGTRLAAAIEWADRHPDDLTTVERDYLDTSRAAAQAETLRRRRTIRRLRALAAALAAVLAIAAAAGTMAAVQRARADRAALSADVRALRARAAAEQRWDLALLYAAQAARWQPSPETRATLLSTLQRLPEAIGVMRADTRIAQLAANRDGSTVVTGDNLGEVVVWNAATHHRRVTIDAMPGLSLMFLNLSDDGRHLVTGSYLLGQPGLTGDQAVTITVDLRAAQPGPRRLPVAGVVAAAYTARGTLIVRRQNGRLQEVDPDTGRVLRTFAGPTVRGECGAPYLVMSPNRRYLTSACGLNEHQPAGAWEVSTGREIWRDPTPSRAWRAINDHGTTLVRGDIDGTITVVDIRTGRTRKAAPGHTAPMTITWSPDGRTFTTSSLDFTSIVWDAASLQPRVVLRGPSGRIIGAAYSPDSRTLYTASWDHNVYVWDLDGAARLAQPIGAAPVSSTPTDYARFNQAGTVLAALYPDTGQLQIHQLDRSHPRNYTLTGPQLRHGYGSGLDLDAAGRTAAILSLQPPTGRLVAHILDVATRRFRPFTIPVDAPPPAAPAPGDTGPPAALSLSADGATLTTIDFHGRIRQWDTTTGARRGQIVYQASGPALYLARSPDPHLIAVATGPNTVELVDLDRRRRLWATTITGASQTGLPVFSPDGRLMAVGTWQGEIAVIDTRTGAIQRRWQAADGYVATPAFTPDGRYLVSGGSDGRAVLWRLDTAPAGSAAIDVDRLTGATISVYAPDDRHIITVNPIGPVLRWDIDPASLITRACAIAARNLTDDEWRQLVPNRPYQPTCP